MQPLHIPNNSIKLSTNTICFDDINLKILIKNFDDYFIDAGNLIIERSNASKGFLQRFYKIGFNRASRILDDLQESGVIGE